MANKHERFDAIIKILDKKKDDEYHRLQFIYSLINKKKQSIEQVSLYRTNYFSTRKKSPVKIDIPLFNVENFFFKHIQNVIERENDQLNKLQIESDHLKSKIQELEKKIESIRIIKEKIEFNSRLHNSIKDDLTLDGENLNKIFMEK